MPDPCPKCGVVHTLAASCEDFDAYKEEHVTAQVVVDAIRFLLMAQDDGAKALRIVKELLEWAPATDNDRGIALIMRMLSEGSLKAEMT